MDATSREHSLSLAHLAALPLSAADKHTHTYTPHHPWQDAAFQQTYIQRCKRPSQPDGATQDQDATHSFEPPTNAHERRWRRLRLASVARRQRLEAQVDKLRDRGRGFALRMETIVNRADVAAEAAVRATLRDERAVAAEMDERCQLLSAELWKHRSIVDRHMELFRAATDRRAQRTSQLRWLEWLETMQRDVVSGAPSKRAAQAAERSWSEVAEHSVHYEELARKLMATVAARKEFGPHTRLELRRLFVLSSSQGPTPKDRESTKRSTRCYNAPLDPAQYTKLVQCLARREAVCRFGQSVPRVATFAATTPLTSATISWLRTADAASYAVKPSMFASDPAVVASGIDLSCESWQLPHIFYCREGEEQEGQLDGWLAHPAHDERDRTLHVATCAATPRMGVSGSVGVADSTQWMQRHVCAATVRHLFEIVRAWLPTDDQAALVANYAATGHAAPPQLDGDGSGRLRSLYCMSMAREEQLLAGGRRACVLRACSELELRELMTVYLIRSDHLLPQGGANDRGCSNDDTVVSISAPTAADIIPAPFNSKVQGQAQGLSTISATTTTPARPSDLETAAVTGTGDVLCLVLRQDKDKDKDRAGAPWPEALLHLRVVGSGRGADATATGARAGAGDGAAAGAGRAWPWYEDSTAAGERIRDLQHASTAIFSSYCYSVGCRSSSYHHAYISPGSSSGSAALESSRRFDISLLRPDKLGRHLCQGCIAFTAGSVMNRNQHARGQGQARSCKARDGGSSRGRGVRGGKPGAARESATAKSGQSPRTAKADHDRNTWSDTTAIQLEYCSLAATRRCADDLVQAALPVPGVADHGHKNLISMYGRPSSCEDYDCSYVLNFGMGTAHGKHERTCNPDLQVEVQTATAAGSERDWSCSDSMPWIEWSPALRSLLCGDVDVDMRALAVSLCLRLKPLCARLLESWLMALPHPPADKRGWVALSELALNWSATHEQHQRSDVNMAKVAAAASGQPALYEMPKDTNPQTATTPSTVAVKRAAQEGLGAGADDTEVDMSVALLAADAVAERVALEARYEKRSNAKPKPTLEGFLKKEQSHPCRPDEATIAHHGSLAASGMATSVTFTAAPDEAHFDAHGTNDYYTGVADDALDQVGGQYDNSQFNSTCREDQPEEGSEEEEDEEIRRLRDELARLKNRRRERQAEAQAQEYVPSATVGSSPEAAGMSQVQPQPQPQYQHPPSVGGWVVPKMRLASSDSRGHDAR